MKSVAWFSLNSARISSRLRLRLGVIIGTVIDNLPSPDDTFKHSMKLGKSLFVPNTVATHCMHVMLECQHTR